MSPVKRASNSSNNEVAFSNPMSQDDEEPGGADLDLDAKAQMVKDLQNAAFGKVEEDEDGDEAVDLRMRAKWGGILHPDMRSRGIYDLFQVSTRPARALTLCKTRPLGVAALAAVDRLALPARAAGMDFLAAADGLCFAALRVDSY